MKNLSDLFTRFTVGKHYKIEKEVDFYVFEYSGMKGLHHCFKEIHGGWSRTYTDAQLIGKKIEEIS